jgi:hypothetical protein
MNISVIRDELYKSRFVNEHDYLIKTIKENENLKDLEEEENKEENNIIKLRISQLEEIILKLTNSNKKKYTKTKFDEISELMYHKVWSKLPSFHKLNRINIYLEETIKDKENLKEILIIASQLVETNKFQNKYVEYDYSLAKITKITNIELNEETDMYEFV